MAIDDSIPHLGDCEFCDELRGDAGSRFHRQLGAWIDDRVVLSEDGFVAVPSMGQIVPGCLMLLPTSHVDRFADLDRPRLEVAAEIIETLVSAAAGPVAVFEHGARSCTGGSCGIYHAHIHIVPLPTGLTAEHIAEELTGISDSFVEAVRGLSIHDEYLLLSDEAGRTWVRPVARTERAQFPSQYFRRVLAAAAGNFEWDWRRVDQPEPALLDALYSWRERLSVASKLHQRSASC